MQNLFNCLSVINRLHRSLICRMVSLDGAFPREQAVRPSPTAATIHFKIATGAHHGCSLLTATFGEMEPTLLPICDHCRDGEVARVIQGLPITIASGAEHPERMRSLVAIQDTAEGLIFTTT
jgi:hypothetical protein